MNPKLHVECGFSTFHVVFMNQVCGIRVWDWIHFSLFFFEDIFFNIIFIINKRLTPNPVTSDQILNRDRMIFFNSFLRQCASNGRPTSLPPVPPIV
jgi:hypothetical protein